MTSEQGGPTLDRKPRAIEVALGLVSTALLILYPVVVYFGFSRLGVRGAALLLLAALTPVAFLRARRLRNERIGVLAFVPIATVGLLAAGAALRAASLVLAVPTTINVLLLAMFAPTLVQGPPMIERFARLSHPDLREDEARWCRQWTIVWSVFFLLNAITAAALAAWAPLAWWVFHTSVLGYAMMGALLLSEWFVRKLRFRRFGGGPVDRLLERVSAKNGLA